VGFQETDIVSIVKPITKYAATVREPSRIAYELEKAFFISMHCRMGPVLLDLPLDVQKADIDPTALEKFIGSEEHRELSIRKKAEDGMLERIAKAITDSQRPVILAGHGVKLSGSIKKFRDFVEKSGIPVVASLMGTDAIPFSHPQYFGFIGTYGQRYSNFALANSDLIIVLGARLDSRQVGVQKKQFAPMARIIHVDIDGEELGASVNEWASLNMDIREFLDSIVPLLGQKKDRNEWYGFLESLRKQYPKAEQKINEGEIDPVEAVRLLSKHAQAGETICADVGSNQMWFAQGWETKEGQTILTDGGMAPMGFSLPAAIGASICSGKRRAWCVTGDGGFQINIQELQTIARNGLPIKISILNNSSLGMLAQFQTENFEGRLIGSADGYDAPDFVRIAEAYGVPAKRVSEKDGLDSGLQWLAGSGGPALLDIIVPKSYWALPKARFSRPVYDMAPLLAREELRKALKYVDYRFIPKEVE
jgi:acetolactate synthase-1/2/3 large subunit